MESVLVESVVLVITVIAIIEGYVSTMQCPQRKFMSCDEFRSSSPNLASSLSSVDRDLLRSARRCRRDSGQ